MTRLTHLLTALVLGGMLAIAAVLACGPNPVAPREMPRLAPRPERLLPTALPGPTASEGGSTVPLTLAAASQPGAPDAGTPGMAPADGGGGPGDAGPGVGQPRDANVADSLRPPRSPISDGGPGDSGFAPIAPRD